jgi:disulfide bond formation protein DsbB
VFYHVAACPLCVVQRMLYLAIALASLAGFVWISVRAVRTLAALLITVAAAGGAAIAAYQIYLQRNPFAATCGDGTAGWERMVQAAGEMVPFLFKANGLCSDSTWSLLSLSIVEWSLLAFSGLCVIGLAALFSRTSH